MFIELAHLWGYLRAKNQLRFYRMNDMTSEECLSHVVSTQMLVFRTLKSNVATWHDGEIDLCDCLVFLKRFALMSNAPRKHFVSQGFPSELISIAGKPPLKNQILHCFVCKFRFLGGGGLLLIEYKLECTT